MLRIVSVEELRKLRRSELSTIVGNDRTRNSKTAKNFSQGADGSATHRISHSNPLYPLRMRVDNDYQHHQAVQGSRKV